MKSFKGEKIENLEHHVTPQLSMTKPGFAFIHIESNNVSYKNLDIDASVLAENFL